MFSSRLDQSASQAEKEYEAVVCCELEGEEWAISRHMEIMINLLIMFRFDSQPFIIPKRLGMVLIFFYQAKEVGEQSPYSVDRFTLSVAHGTLLRRMIK